MSFVPIIVLAVVFILIAVRRVGNLRLKLWKIMFGGALAVLLTGQISALDAFNAINLDVMIFLLFMFIIASALEVSGYLSYLSYKLFKKANNLDILLLFVLFGMGFASAILMNDTIAIIGTPVMLILAKKHNIKPQVLLIALAFSITIGSVMSPIGNPQNLLIAVDGGVANPFVTFLKHLFIPTAINLVFAFLLIRFFYRDQFHEGRLSHAHEQVLDEHLALCAKASLVLLVTLIITKIVLVSLIPGFDFRLTYIAVIAALPVLLFSKKRLELLGKSDWHILIFFASMFVLMESVWETGFFQGAISSFSIDVASILVIFTISILLSQLISNVPLVALYLPLFSHVGATTKELMALAAGSTIAGNLFILGAASNVIIIQNAEKRAGETITFLDFAKIGIPLTLINAGIYWVFLSIF